MNMRCSLLIVVLASSLPQSLLKKNYLAGSHFSRRERTGTSSSSAMLAYQQNDEKCSHTYLDEV